MQAEARLFPLHEYSYALVRVSLSLVLHTFPLQQQAQLLAGVKDLSTQLAAKTKRHPTHLPRRYRTCMRC